MFPAQLRSSMLASVLKCKTDFSELVSTFHGVVPRRASWLVVFMGLWQSGSFMEKASGGEEALSWKTCAIC